MNPPTPTVCDCRECSVEVTHLPELDADAVFCAVCVDHCCDADREFCGLNGCDHCGEARATTSDQHGNRSCAACAAMERAA